MLNPQPGETWVNPYGRAHKVLARDVTMENGRGQKWGPLASLQALDDSTVTTMVWQRELDAPVQRELLI